MRFTESEGQGKPWNGTDNGEGRRKGVGPRSTRLVGGTERLNWPRTRDCLLKMFCIRWLARSTVGGSMAEAWVRHLVAKSCLDRFPRSQRIVS